MILSAVNPEIAREGRDVAHAVQARAQLGAAAQAGFNVKGDHFAHLHEDTQID